MTIYRHFVTASILACLSSTVAAQSEISVGEHLPAGSIGHVLNYASNAIDLSTISNKIIIVDFWGPSCMSCLESFPKIGSLQKQFQGKVQFLLVNNQSEDSTRRFLSLHKALKVPRGIPMITEDNLLSKYFPHRGMPYHVWIDSGVVKFKIEGSSTTAKNIERYMKQQSVIVRDYSVGLNRNSLFDEEAEPNIGYYSYISKQFGNVHILNRHDNDKVFEFALADATILDLYITAYNEWDKFAFDKPGRLKLVVSDSTKYFASNEEDNGSNNRYMYDLSMPKERKKDFYKYMQQDLDRYFHLKATIETKPVESYVLVCVKKTHKLDAKGTITKTNFGPVDARSTRFDSIRYMYNCPFGSFVDGMTYIFEKKFKAPFIDGTGIDRNKKVDIIFQGKNLDSLSITGLQNELKKYDLRLVHRPYPFTRLKLQEIQEK